MEKFLAEYDPLAALDAEYAAVVAQTRPSSKEPVNAASADNNQLENDPLEPAQSDDEDEDEDSMGEEQYALLPTSPAGSGDGFDDDEDDEDVANADVAPKPEPASQPAAQPMDATTKQTIMASMQGLRLQPPPWASDSAIGDDELIALVQKRLQLRADAAATKTEQ